MHDRHSRSIRIMARDPRVQVLRAVSTLRTRHACGECATRGLMSIGFFQVPDNLTEKEVLALYVRHVIASEGGNKSAAARRLGLDRRSLYRRLHEMAK
jgi:DNA-binding NtrC family response regulator